MAIQGVAAGAGTAEPADAQGSRMVELHENDCGTAALYACLRAAAFKPDLAEVASRLRGDGDRGRLLSMAELRNAARACGAPTVVMRWAEEPPRHGWLPAVVAVSSSRHQLHFVALLRIENGRALVFDFAAGCSWQPWSGLRDRGWDGVALHVGRNEAALRAWQQMANGRHHAALIGCALGGCLHAVALRLARRRARVKECAKPAGPATAGTVPRRGISLIEVLVVLAVLALLLALLAPAVQSARERADRTACLNRLRQIALACDAHHELHGKYPESRFPHVDGVTGRRDDLNASVFVALLPLLDLRELASGFDAQETGEGLDSDPPTSRFNAMLMTARVPVLQCPAEGAGGGWCNYRACVGTGPALHETVPADNRSARRGVFGVGASRSADIRDGLSNTVFFSERVTGDRDSGRYTPWTDIHFRQPSRGGFLYPDDAAADCGSSEGAVPRHVSFAGATWLQSGFNTTWYNHVLAPNSRTPDCASHDRGARVADGAVSARSWHAGGVHAAFGDGSARFIAEEIHLDVWRGLASIRGGEAVEP